MPRKPCRPAHPPQLREDTRQTSAGIEGKNIGEIAQHNIVLAAILEQLLKDERMLLLFYRWSESLGDKAVSYQCPITFDPPAHSPIIFGPPTNVQMQEAGFDYSIFKAVVEGRDRFWERFIQRRSQFFEETFGLVRDELNVPWTALSS